ncbi:MAG TPA: secretin N-terminal domain-containing protein [Vicinamibacterales bacterium]|nr:secretin N-terminal domain-containing protein [Vicinamibacterales bacterium]
MTRWLRTLGVLLVAAIAVTGCAASRAFSQGEDLVRSGNFDEAVVAYRRAVQEDPDNPNYAIALQRTMVAASRAHLDTARQFEEQGQLEAALSEYRLASEYDPSNRTVMVKTASIEQTIRDRIEAARPRPAIEQLQEQARLAGAQPVLNPASREPLILRFPNANVRDVLGFIANATGINITYDRDVADGRPITIQLDGVTLEQALNQIMTMSQLSYKVVNERSIFVFPDTQPKHTLYDEQVVRTFYISNADPTELSQTLSQLIRIPGIAIQPMIAVNKTTNTITVRSTAPIMEILEKIIAQNDKPRAEIVVDVEILEVDRARTKSYGLNLSEYAVGAIFSPVVAPGITAAPPANGGTGTGTTGTGGNSTAPGAVVSPPVFNLNTITRGVSTADFYLAVPTAIVRFLETDTRTKVIAKPQLRGAEGSRLQLNLGQKIPVVSTSYTPIATGGAGVNPLSSYTYQDVGVNIDMTPRVSLDGEIILDLILDNSAVGPDKAVAGVTVPTFVQRRLATRLRLRDGESNLLAGLIAQRDSNSVRGLPGAIYVPFLREVFSGNDTSSDQTEIIMLLTPHIVRTQELTASDLSPIYIGSQQNLGVGGPPPLIANPAEPEAAAPAPPPTGQATPAPLPTLVGPGGVPVTIPPGSTPVPGTVVAPPAATPAPPGPVPQAPVPTPPAPPAVPAPPTPDAAPTTVPGLGQAQVIISPPGTTLRVNGGPYTIPLSVTNATGLSTITLTLIFDPSKLRVRSVQQGSFMRTGGVDVVFTQEVSGNRIDITLTRTGDATGASGTGLLAAILFDAIEPGTTTLSLSGAAAGPGGTAMGLRFQPVTITVQ